MTNQAEKTFNELIKLGINNAEGYLYNLARILENVKVDYCPLLESTSELVITLDSGINLVINNLKQNVLINRKRLVVIGNGGSAAIAIHTLTDYANAGGLRTVDFMSPSLLTCMANDYGFENVFAKPIEIWADAGDILFAISSSGKSPDILKACQAAREKGCIIYTFSGFDPGNPLRSQGRLNFYVPSTHYGFVELAHQTLIHCILDLFLLRKNQNWQ